MRYMAMIKFDENADVGSPPPELFRAMDEFAQEGARNGTLVDQGGLLPSATGAIVSLVNGAVKTTDGPFTEAKELIGGYAIVQVKSKQEAIEMAKHFLKLHEDVLGLSYEGNCEIRQMFDPSDFGPEGR